MAKWQGGALQKPDRGFDSHPCVQSGTAAKSGKLLTFNDLRFGGCPPCDTLSRVCAILSLDFYSFMGYIIGMKTIMISPTKKASQRTKNRIRENGPVFEFVQETGSNWMLRGRKLTVGSWVGWLPRNEFHVECVGKKFIEKVLG